MCAAAGLIQPLPSGFKLEKERRNQGREGEMEMLDKSPNGVSQGKERRVWGGSWEDQAKLCPAARSLCAWAQEGTGGQRTESA